MMADEQKEKIKQIANEVVLSRGSIRGYCRRYGLDGFGEKLAMQHKMLL
ncbi:MAG: hypothetical protein Q8936_19550 [Bacillota bacterium]|nr:hypothetical protein [Bacillota bacterium]